MFILRTSTRNIWIAFGLALLALFSFFMLRIIWVYAPMHPNTEFLKYKQDYLHITPWLIAFYVHVFMSILVLLAGFTQFSGQLLRKHPKIHRALGYAYVLNILMVTGPASLLMGFYANGGVSSRIAFVTLSTLWIGFTALALYKAAKKQFAAHRIFMIRSFSLTLSAISLRIWKILLMSLTHLPPDDRYRIIAWLGWTINLLVAEWYISRHVKTAFQR